MFQVLSSAPKKRRVESPIECDDVKENIYGVQSQCFSKLVENSTYAKNFLRLPGNGAVYQSEEWKDKNTTLYSPVSQDVMINLRCIEQLSFATGTFFTADDQGIYKASQEGYVLNLWRYSEKERQLYISRSLLITDFQVVVLFGIDLYLR